MRETIRALRLIVTSALRADWRRALATLIEPLGQAAQPLLGLWLALLVDGAARRDGLLVAGGVTGIAFSESLTYVGELYGSSIRLALSEAVGHAFDREIAELASSLPGLEHHERAEYRDRLELLRQSQAVLGRSLNSCIATSNAVVTAAVILGLLASADPLFLAMGLLGIPSAWIAKVFQRWMKRAEEASAEPRRLAHDLRLLLFDRRAAADIRVANAEAELIERHRAAWIASQRPILRVRSLQRLNSTAEQVLFMLAYAGVVGLTLWRAVHGHGSAGQVALVAVVGAQVQQRVIAPIWSVANLGTHLRSAGRLLWLRDYAAEQSGASRGDARAPSYLREGLTLEHAGFRYPGSDTWAVRDITCRIPAGSVVALVGENGAGKTSLVKLLCRFYDPTEGRILVDGIPLSSIEHESWRARLTVAFQDFCRFELVAGHSVGIGRLPLQSDDEAALGALERAGAASVVDALPAGLATQLGAGWDGGVDLSVGQWQKLALGRALMREQPLLAFFDEPTASLDATTEHTLFERYAEQARAGRARGAITVLVSHRFSTVRIADIILVLDQGHLVEAGTHNELVARDGQYARLYDLQARSYR